MRSLSVKSRMFLMCSARVISTYGIDWIAESARISFAVPAVLSHIVASVGTPGAMKSIWPERIASIIAVAFDSVVQETLSATPCFSACFSRIWKCSITMKGRYGRPYCLESRTSETSARADPSAAARIAVATKARSLLRMHLLPAVRLSRERGQLYCRAKWGTTRNERADLQCRGRHGRSQRRGGSRGEARVRRSRAPHHLWRAGGERGARRADARKARPAARRPPRDDHARHDRFPGAVLGRDPRRHHS